MINMFKLKKNVVMLQNSIHVHISETSKGKRAAFKNVWKILPYK